MAQAAIALEPRPTEDGVKSLKTAGLIWYLTAAAGQAGFIYFIVAYYWSRTLAGDYPAWNEKPLIDGYTPGDRMGNVMFALHVLPAAVITLGGLVQLIPNLRDRFPAVHRWNGRLFLFIAYGLALGGIVLTWGRGTYLSPISGIAITIDGLLILAFGAVAWRLAVKGDFDAHRRWAMRTFIVVNGVWFFRVMIMAWIILNQGPVGMTNNLDGPADIAIAFGCYLIPLAVLEVYFAAQRSQSAAPKYGAAVLVLAMTGLMAVGIFGTVAFMWGPYL
ncbi:MAG: DUF2306 domain-containing protein [Pseudomonadota bacterium]